MTILPLTFQISDFFTVPIRFYEPLNEQKWMCELHMHVFPNLVTITNFCNQELWLAQHGQL